MFNIVHGGGLAGAYLVAHPLVAQVSFTGQVSTGQKVATSAAASMKHITMELGGKSPPLIIPDADINNAVDVAMMANFYSTGQVCTNGTRVFVPCSLKGEFERRLVAKMEYIHSGDVRSESTNFGPLVTRRRSELQSQKATCCI